MKSILLKFPAAIAALIVASCGGGSGGPAADDAGSAMRVATAVQDPAQPVVCQDGGVTVNSGTDTNGNDFLDPSEVISTRYVCNGASGGNGPRALFLVTAEPAGTNCAAGGKKVSAGRDVNANAALDAAEVVVTGYFCKGAAAGNLAHHPGSHFRMARVRP